MKSEQEIRAMFLTNESSIENMKNNENFLLNHLELFKQMLYENRILKMILECEE